MGKRGRYNCSTLETAYKFIKKAVTLAAFFIYKKHMAHTKKTDDQAVYLEPTPSQVGLRGCCPRCGQGKLFASILKPAKTCMNCDLDFEFIDSGDGPAVFVILIIGFLVTAMAMALQSSYAPPIWVHMLLWIPMIIILSTWGLQFAKGIMIALQYKTKAEQGALDSLGK